MGNVSLWIFVMDRLCRTEIKQRILPNRQEILQQQQHARAARIMSLNEIKCTVA